jgi:hypothetical protein
MSEREQAHPGPEQLRAFGLGRLGAAERQALEGHIATCAFCCQALQDVADDALVGLLRQDCTTPHAAPTLPPAPRDGGEAGTAEAAAARAPFARPEAGAQGGPAPAALLSRRRVLLGVAAATLAACALLGRMLYRRTRSAPAASPGGPKSSRASPSCRRIQ